MANHSHTTMKPLFIFICLSQSLLTLWGQPFQLSDSDPNSPEFKARFLASYGVNAKIEPTLSQADQKIFQATLPLLKNNTYQAITMLLSKVNSESNAAFDFLLGNLYYQRDDFAQAEQHLNEAIRKMPDFRRAHRTLALSKIQRQDFKQAARLWKKVIALGGGDAQSFGLLAFSLLSQDHYASAQTAYEQARMFAPESRDFKKGLAHCLIAQSKHLEAIALFDELIEEETDNQSYWLLQANAFIALDQYDDAIANLETASQLGRMTGDSWLLLGNLYLNQEVTQLALDRYLKVLENNENLKRDSLLKPLNDLINRSATKEARLYFDKLNQTFNRQRTDPYLAKKLDLAEARILQSEGKNREVIRILKAYADENPLDGDILMTLANTYFSQDQIEESEFYYQRAALLPDYQADAYVSLARIQVKAGIFSKAIQYLEQAQSIKPRDPIEKYLDQIKASKF